LQLPRKSLLPARFLQEPFKRAHQIAVNVFRIDPTSFAAAHKERAAMPPIFHPTDLSQRFLRRAMSGLPALPTRMMRGLVRWAEEWRQKRHLAELDEHLLKDIGLSDFDGRRDVAIRELYRR
jgi:uncharacterized protein YjiS (DUF1127 family)